MSAREKYQKNNNLKEEKEIITNSNINIKINVTNKGNDLNRININEQPKKKQDKIEEKDNKSKSLQKIEINKQINEKEEKNKISHNKLITSKSYKNLEEINNNDKKENKRTWRFSIKNKEENDNIIPIQKVDNIKDKKLVESKSFSHLNQEIKKEELDIKKENKDLIKKQNIQQISKKEKEPEEIIVPKKDINKSNIKNNEGYKIKESSIKININQIDSNINSK